MTQLLDLEEERTAQFPKRVHVRKPSRLPRAYFLLLALVFALPAIYYAAQHLPAPAPVSNQLSGAETAYFRALYQDTWNYLATYVDETTGLPYDSSAKQPATSLSNIGLYLASVATAYRTGLISETEGLRRVQYALESLGQIESWRGIPRPWIITRNLKPTHGDEFSYGPHVANLLGGLIVAGVTFPEASRDILHLILEMQFRNFYDATNGWLKGGYNVKTENFAVFQPWGHWYYKFLASETRLLSFYLVARKIVPKRHWTSLVRTPEKKLGEKFFVSGYEDGGLAPQYMAGLFLDERTVEMGGSQRAASRYQMKHAKEIDSPVWGWTASETPKGRFLGPGELRDDTVAPSASILASIYFPKEVYQNLKQLELLGARPDEGFGFRDSINWKTGELTRNYLTLNQAMAFLSMANLLYDGIVWKTFAEDATVKQGLEAESVS